MYLHILFISFDILGGELPDVQTLPEVAEVLKDTEQRLPVKRAGADNTTKWSKFVKEFRLA